MPDHVHFFCRPEHEAKTLSRFVGAWKTWTSRKIQKGRPQPTAAATTPQQVIEEFALPKSLRSCSRCRRLRLQLRKLFGNANSSITCCGLARATAKNGIIFVRIPYEADWSRPPMIGLTQVRSTDWNSKRPLKNMPNRLVFRPIAFLKSAPASIQQPQTG